MAHNLQEKYSNLVDMKLRKTLVTQDNLIFNNRYEGDPAAGVVNIPVRDMEVVVEDYNKANGISAKEGGTTYLKLSLDNDIAVNELIDGYDAAAVPDGIVAERLDSAGYSLSQVVDARSITALEKAQDINVAKLKTATAEGKAYEEVLKAMSALTRAGVPQDGRWLIASPELYAMLLNTPQFVKVTDPSSALDDVGIVGKVAGFAVCVSNGLAFEDNTLVSGKKTTTEFIAGHSNWCHRVMAWQKPVALQDLSGSGKYIGASAVQGRYVFGVKVSKGKALYTKRIEA